MAIAREAGVTWQDRRERNLVLWVGASPDAATMAEFAQRELNVKLTTLVGARESLRFARGLVLSFDPAAPLLTRDALHHLSKTALNHGVLVYALSRNDTDLKMMSEQRAGLRSSLRD